MSPRCLLALASGALLLSCAARNTTQTTVATTPVVSVPNVADGAPAEALRVEPPRPSTGTLRIVVQNTAQQPLPARLTIRGVEGTRDPDLGPANSAAGAGVIAITVTGEASFTLTPGTYEVTVSHGPEWSLHRQRTSVRAEQTAVIEASLSHDLPLDDWTACDFHLHAAPSFDSRVSIPDRVATLVSTGVTFATPTEHNVVGDYTEGVEALPAPAREPGLAWIPAVEVTTDRADFPVGHFNVFPWTRTPNTADGAPPDWHLRPPELFRTIRERARDTIIQVNHPRMAPNIGYFDRAEVNVQTNQGSSQFYAANYDAIEVFNGYYLADQPHTDRVLRDWLSLLETGARYTGTANSDSHNVSFSAAGFPRTYVYTPGAHGRPDPRVLLRALREGRAFGTSGPLIFLSSGTAQIGDTVRPPTEQLRVQVRVRAPTWMNVDRVELFVGTTLAQTIEVPPSTNFDRLQTEVTLTVPPGRHPIVAVARSNTAMEAILPGLNAKPYAFTNPLWSIRPRGR